MPFVLSLPRALGRRSLSPSWARNSDRPSPCPTQLTGACTAQPPLSALCSCSALAVWLTLGPCPGSPAWLSLPWSWDACVLPKPQAHFSFRGHSPLFSSVGHRPHTGLVSLRFGRCIFRLRPWTSLFPEYRRSGHRPSGSRPGAASSPVPPDGQPPCSGSGPQPVGSLGIYDPFRHHPGFCFHSSWRSLGRALRRPAPGGHPLPGPGHHGGINGNCPGSVRLFAGFAHLSSRFERSHSHRSTRSSMPGLAGHQFQVIPKIFRDIIKAYVLCSAVWATQLRPLPTQTPQYFALDGQTPRL